MHPSFPFFSHSSSEQLSSVDVGMTCPLFVCMLPGSGPPPCTPLPFCGISCTAATSTPPGELTWPLGLQQEVQEDHQAKMRAAQRGGGGLPRPQQIRAIMLGRLDKMNDIKYMTPTGAHRDGGPFGISLESLTAQGVSLETGALWDVIPKY